MSLQSIRQPSSHLALSRPWPASGRERLLERQAAVGQTEQRDDQEDDEASPVEGQGGTDPGGVGADRRADCQGK